MKKFVLAFALIPMSFLGYASRAQDTTPQSLPTLADLKATCNEIVPGGDTICSKCTPFSFFVRPGDPRKLLIHFQAGGACWNGETCDPLLVPTFDPVIDTTDHPSRAAGILSLHLLDNPVHDFSIIVVPYCTGDLHLGTRAVTYRSPGAQLIPARDFTVRHWGARNVESVLRWAYRHFAQPELIFVNGSMFQAMGNTIPPLVASVTRILVVAIPTVLMASMAGFELRWLWWLSVAATLLQLGMNLFLLRREFRVRLRFA